MSPPTTPQRRTSRRRLVPRNLLTYDGRRQLREPAIPPPDRERDAQPGDLRPVSGPPSSKLTSCRRGH